MIQVRKSKYRGQEGWKVSGYPPGSNRSAWPVSVFFEHETAARRYAKQLRDGVPVDCLKIDWSP